MRKIFIYYVIAILYLITGSIRFGYSDNVKEGKINIFNVEKGTFEEVLKIKPDKEELRKTLTKEQFHITQEQGTEPSFTGKLLDNKKTGVYKCVVCGTDLFLSETKFDSKTGWPSFWQPVAKENVGERADRSFFMNRTEVHCPRCNAHLGHIFDDGPAPTHKRYCINSASLKFQSMEKSE